MVRVQVYKNNLEKGTKQFVKYCEKEEAIKECMAHNRNPNKKYFLEWGARDVV